MTKTVKILLCIVLVLVALIGGMVLFVGLRNDRPANLQIQGPTLTVSTQAAETSNPEETTPETTAVETEPAEVPTPGEKRISRIVSHLSQDAFTEESFFYDHAGNPIRHLTTGYHNGAQTYTIDRRYLYDRDGMLVKIQDVENSHPDTEFHYEQGVLTGYTYYEIMADEIAYSVTYHYERDELGNVVKITTTGSESDIWTIGEYTYDDLDQCISAYEQERYGDHDFERRMTYDHSYRSAVIATKQEALFGSETTTRRIQFGDQEYGYIYGPELYENYEVIADVNGCIAAVKDASGQTVASFEYFTLPSDSPAQTVSASAVPADFSEFPSEFVFSSGAGGWGTYLTIEADGSFTGEYHDSEMGDQGEGYPRGTVYICGFEGKFTEPEKVSDHIYSMKLDTLTVYESAGKEYIENEIRYIVSEPHGMENGELFYIYLPGAAIADLPEGFLSWTHIDTDIRQTLPSGFWGIYNEGGEAGFTAMSDGNLWYRSYNFEYQRQTTTLRPSYYDRSQLVFGLGYDMVLEFPWSRDDQTEFRACDYRGGTGGYDISLAFSEDLSSVTVTVRSINGVDLSPWGGTPDGTLTATFNAE